MLSQQQLAEGGAQRRASQGQLDGVGTGLVWLFLIYAAFSFFNSFVLGNHHEFHPTPCAKPVAVHAQRATHGHHKDQAVAAKPSTKCELPK